MGTPNKYCTNADPEAPVCPPMWNCPIENVRPPMPIWKTPDLRKKPAYTERVLRKPIDPFPGGDPDLVVQSSNTPGSASAGSSTTDKDGRFCRQCGPRILGVIGVPNADPNAPWPAVDANNAEVNPFIMAEEFSGPEANDVIRAAGNYTPEYTTYEQSNVLLQPLPQGLAVSANFLVLAGDGNNPPQNWDIIPSSGTVYIHGETIQYSGKAQAGVGGVWVLSGLTRSLPQANRTAKANNENAIILLGVGTGNTSASIRADVAANRSISAWNLKTNLSRGSNFSDNSVLVVQNSNLGGTNANGGITLVEIRTTHWPDEDVTTCIVAEDPSKIDIARQYCCFNDTLTADDWAGGAGRCAALAQYSVGRPGEWAQHCPDGYEYAPGADGLFCKKCGTGTSTFDPTVNPANCPANGVGCQKCCENPGVQCN